MLWRLVQGLLMAPFFVMLVGQAAIAARISLSQDSPRQGQTVEVTVTGVDASSPPDVKFNGSDYKLFPSQEEGSYRTLVAVPADLEPGSYKLQVGDDAVPLRVLAGLFPLQHLRLPPAKDNFDMSPGEKEAVDGAKQTVSAVRLWQGRFLRPSRARISTGFGLKRMVNGRLLKDYYHSGLDFAAAAGSPITSSADGTVILVGRNFKLHGNCVAVDHGQGVVSFYLHMRTFNVTKGEHVKAGDKLGTVGSTGRATGPHLHFSLVVNQVSTNPMDWFQHSF
jgi:murein DD-endopeptidase MepM/ murein hydrolase activator NlpD